MSRGQDVELGPYEFAGVTAALELLGISKLVSVPTAAIANKAIGPAGYRFEQADIPLANRRCLLWAAATGIVLRVAATISIALVAIIATILTTQTALGWLDLA